MTDTSLQLGIASFKAGKKDEGALLLAKSRPRRAEQRARMGLAFQYRHDR